ncbi:isoprenoid synthase domain-containing protein [Blastocladiella britannica]|nr:isoprenoid synthase domain-containing protein [Blastocladiella britannica]
MSSLLKSIFHPSELVALAQYAVQERRRAKSEKSKVAGFSSSSSSLASASAAATSGTTDHDKASGAGALSSTARHDSASTLTTSSPPEDAAAVAGSTLARSYYYLDRTSRSFAAVIRALHPDLRDAVCIFYLALRGLDTVEDDMTIPLPRKLQVLLHFHEHLATPGWSFTENALADKDRDLLVEFHVVVDQFLRLPVEFQAVIGDITEKMAKGMAFYCERAYEQDQAVEKAMASDLAEDAESAVLLSGNRVQSIEEYDQYCHYVAGLVGHGLTRLFLASGLESSQALAADNLHLANSMGLFLQKINITRDFHEDFEENRAFWPREIWGNYAHALAELLESSDNYGKGRAALNHQCANALTHVRDSLVYLSHLSEPSVFRFCAIPQVMAIATLAEVYNNPSVFKGAVKIRKGLAVQLILQATDMASVRAVFLRFTRDLQRGVDAYIDELTYVQQQSLGEPHDELAKQRAANVAREMRAACVDVRVACGEAREVIKREDDRAKASVVGAVVRAVRRADLAMAPLTLSTAVAVVGAATAAVLVYKRFATAYWG